MAERNPCIVINYPCRQHDLAQSPKTSGKLLLLKGWELENKNQVGGKLAKCNTLGNHDDPLKIFVCARVNSIMNIMNEFPHSIIMTTLR